MLQCLGVINSLGVRLRSNEYPSSWKRRLSFLINKTDMQNDDDDLADERSFSSASAESASSS